VVVLPALTDEGVSGFENMFDQANLVLADMVAEGAITAQERARMTLLAFPRRKAGLLAPFANGPFQQLTVEDFEMSSLPDAAWNEYKQDGNKEALAAKHALFFRSVFMPSLASALDRVREGDAEALRASADRLEAGLKRRMAKPADSHEFLRADHRSCQAVLTVALSSAAPLQPDRINQILPAPLPVLRWVLAQSAL
jgi:hypothetical protein